MINLFMNKYECKLSTRAILGIEKALGDNPVNLIIKNEDSIPTLNTLLTILFYSIRKANPQIRTMDNVIDLYDEFIDEGGSIVELSKFVMELIKDSGLIGSGEGSTGDSERKN